MSEIKQRLGSSMSRGAATFVLVLAGLGLSSCSSTQGSVIDQIEERSSSQKARHLCEAWASGVVKPSDVRAAVDSTLSEVAAIEGNLGITEDLNVETDDSDTYAALCVVDGEVASGLGQTRFLYYQLENGGGIALAGTS